jgi:VWFA-related protein
MRFICAALVAIGLAQSSAGDLVELDVTVVDRDGRPVPDLGQRDFQVKEDGREVEIKTFDWVRSAGASDFLPRQLVLLLDDTVPIAGTSVIQGMAQAVLSRSRPGDEVTVVRLNNDRDEPFGDIETALSRIDGYRAGLVPVQTLGTAERTLQVLARVSHQLEAVEHRRKLVVCIGGPSVCNVLEPKPRGYSVIWTKWVDAISSMARANVAVYGIMPVRPGTFIMLGGGLVDQTGGDAFFNNVKFDPFVDQLWREASDYYFLGYWPSGRKGELHDIDVKVTRKGVHSRVRRQRG